jgi:hypothetical protein
MPTTAPSPFTDLSQPDAYLDWRDRKLDCYPTGLDDLTVDIADLAAPTRTEIQALRRRCAKANMAIYRAPSTPSRDAVRALGASLGLHRLDNNLSADGDFLTAIEVVPNRRGHDYIPHTDRPLNWHTDGYYNLPNQRIESMTLHCVHPAREGGMNTFLDPERVYICLRDQNPRHIEALMEDNAMTIPANIENGREIRPARTGPVFSISPRTNTLHMRYTARTRSIEWHDDPATAAAVEALERILATDWPWTFHRCLAAGEGIVCNNVLHRRDSFQGTDRLMLRGRYYDRIKTPPEEAGTEV